MATESQLIKSFDRKHSQLRTHATGCRETGQLPTRSDDAMTRNEDWYRISRHDLTDRSRCSRTATSSCQLAIGAGLTWFDSSRPFQDTTGEWGLRVDINENISHRIAVTVEVALDTLDRFFDHSGDSLFRGWCSHRSTNSLGCALSLLEGQLKGADPIVSPSDAKLAESCIKDVRFQKHTTEITTANSVSQAGCRGGSPCPPGFAEQPTFSTTSSTSHPP